MKQGLADVFVPSRLFIYYNERVIEGTVDEDSGAMIRDGIKSVAKQGAPHEKLWPYVIAKFRTRPSAPAYKDAARHPAVLYQRVTREIDQMKGCLASGYPFVFGFSVYESFESQTVATERDTRRCRNRAKPCSAATPSWRSATTTPGSGSSCATRGGRAGGWAGTSRFRSTISSTRT